MPMMLDRSRRRTTGCKRVDDSLRTSHKKSLPGRTLSRRSPFVQGVTTNTSYSSSMVQSARHGAYASFPRTKPREDRKRRLCVSSARERVCSRAAPSTAFHSFSIRALCDKQLAGYVMHMGEHPPFCSGDIRACGRAGCGRRTR